jgi:release factor glutamine methyltransferase
MKKGPAITIAHARRSFAEALRAGGVDTPELDARLLIGHALDLDHAGLVAGDRTVLSPADLDAIIPLVTRRLAHEPVARIVGRKEFWGLDLGLSPDTLVPRPETETLVEAALETIGADRSRPVRMADLGVGSGALLLALLSEFPHAWGIGTDRSVDALSTARRNAAALGLAGRAGFAASDFGTALAGGFDLVVSNPPYVTTGEIDGLSPDVRDHDPRAALDGGADGLAAYRAIVADARRLLAPGGYLVLEIGAGQGPAVSSLCAGAGMAVYKVFNDLGGIPRALLAAPA